MRYTIIALISVAACAAAQGQDAETVDLRPKFVEGRTSVYEFWTRRDETNTTRFGDNERRVEVRYHFTGQVTWRVLRVRGDGSADCEMIFDWFAIEVAAEGETRTADSRKGSSEWEVGHSFARALAGKPLTVRVAADGVIEKVDGVSAIRNAIEGPDDQKPDEKDFMEEASQLAVVWGAPARAKSGDNWAATFAWNHELGTLNYQTRYTLHDVGELEGVPVAMVAAESQMTMDFDRSDIPSDAPPVEMKLDAAGEHEQMIYDLSRGEVAARNITMTLRATQSIRLAEGTVSNVREESLQAQIVRATEQ